MHPPSLAMPRLRCFIVEDSPIILHSLVDTLEQLAPITVVGHADTEASALAWLRQHPQDCDLLILDVYLRQGTGLRVLGALRGSMADMHRVMLTNYATDDVRRRCLEQGASRVFDKSSELEELFAYCTELAEPLAPSMPAMPRADGAPTQ